MIKKKKNMEYLTQGSTNLHLAQNKELIQTGIKLTPPGMVSKRSNQKLASQVLELVSGSEGILPHVIADFLTPYKIIDFPSFFM